MQKPKKFFLHGLTIILILIILIVSVNAFFSSNNKTKTIKVMWWGSQTRHQITLKVIEMFQAKYPDIKVEHIITSWGGYWEKLTTLSAGNDMPDVMQMTIQELPNWSSKNQLADLKKISTIDGLKGMDKSAIDVGMIGNKLYGACLGVNAICFAYDEDIFNKAGVAIPDDIKWTWDDFEKICSTIYDKLQIWGTGNFSQEQFDVYAREKGEMLYAKDLKHVGFKAKTFEEFMEISLRLLQSGGMEPLAVALETQSNEEASSYAKGKCAMRPLWSNKVVGVRKTKGKDSKLLMYPGPNNQEGMYVKPSMFFSIAQSSKVKKDAGTFVSYFINDIEVNKLLNADRGVPAVEEVRDGLKVNLDSQNKIIFDYIAKVGKFSTRPMDPYFPVRNNEASNALRSTIWEVFHETTTPKDAGEICVQRMNDVLSR